MEEDPVVVSRSGRGAPYRNFIQQVIPYAILLMLLFFIAVLVNLFAPEDSCMSKAFQPDGWDRVLIRGAGCVADGVIAYMPDDLGLSVPPHPTLPQPPSPPLLPPILVRDETNSATKVYGRRPIYPEVARVARVCGAVVLDVVVGRTGLVRDVTVVSSVPLLDEAATDAVKQWQYTPMLSEGRRTPFIDLVHVNFEMEVLDEPLDGIKTWVRADAIEPPACP